MSKIIILLLVIVVIVALVFLRWANKIENVESQLKKYEKQREQTITDSIKNTTDKNTIIEFDDKTNADLSMDFDETFINNHYQFLQPIVTTTPIIKNHEILIDTWVYKNTVTETPFAITKNEYENFMVDMEMQINGNGLFIGVIFNYVANEKPNSWNADRICSNPYGVEMTINNHDESKRMSSLSDNLKGKGNFTQIIKLVNKNKQLKLFINDVLVCNKTVELYSNQKGKIGLYMLKQNNRDFDEHAVATIKYFKVSTWKKELNLN